MSRFFFFSLLLFVASSIFPETLLFRSNSMGMTLEKINRFRKDEYDFILTVEKSAEKEVRVLFEKDEEKKRWERTVLPGGLREDIYSSGVLDTVAEYSPRGDLLKEILYREGNPDRTRAYIYENNLLTEIIETDNEGAIISTSTFMRSSAGRMQRAIQSFPSGEARISAYTYSSDGIIQEWHGTADRGDLFRFNADGRTTAEEVWGGDELEIIRRFTYGEGGEYRVIEEDYTRGVTVRRMYDPKDKLHRELTTKKGNLVEDTIYYYEEELLMEKIKKRPGVKERWVYSYDADDDVSREEYFKNGSLKKIISYTGDETYYEELYRNGTPFIRIYYEEERKVREESL